MRSTRKFALLVALLLAACSSRAAVADSASDPKPLAVVSVASYDEVVGNVELVGAVAGKPKLAKGLQGMIAVFTHGKGLAGLDKTRPWGAVIRSVAARPSGYAFLPVEDFEEFLEVFKPHGVEAEDLGNGVYKVQGGKARRAIYAKPTDSGWLFISDQPEQLADVPRDPLPLLGGLNQQYDLAVRLNLSSVPAELRNKVIAQIRRQFDRDLEKRPWEDETQYAVRKMLATGFGEALLTVLGDLETVTLGGSFDQKAQKAFLGIDLSVQEGSKTAKALAESAQAKTDFAGFRLPGAALTASGTASCPYARSADWPPLFDAIRDKALEDIEAQEPSAKRAEVAKEIVEGLLDVAHETAATGRVDGACSLVVTPEAATLVAGRHVAEGRKLEQTLKRLVEALRAEYPRRVEEAIKLDADELDGIRFHTLSMPVPHDMKQRESVVRLVGETLEIVVGIGEERFYLAAGRDAIETLKQAIRRSAGASGESAPAMELSLALSQVAQLMAQTGKPRMRQRAAKAAELLESAGGKDRVRLAVVSGPRDLKLRVEVEEGVLKLLEAMQKR